MRLNCWCHVVAFLLAGAVPAFSDSESDDAIRDLPMIKAYAYALAIDEYCFPDRKFATPDLGVAAFDQQNKATNASAYDSLNAAAERAAIHLRSNYVACEPAMAFVDRTAVDLPQLGARLQQIVDEAAARDAARREREEAEQREQQAAAAAKKAEDAIKDCVATAKRAQEFLATSSSVLYMTFPTSLPKCLETVPDRPEYKELRAEIQQMIPIFNARLKEEWDQSSKEILDNPPPSPTAKPQQQPASKPANTPRKEKPFSLDSLLDSLSGG